MAKKVVSVALHHHQKKRPIRNLSNTKRKLKNIFRKIKRYMKSDTYMYSVLASPQSSVTSPSGSSYYGDECGELVGKKDKEWLQEMEIYLKCDSYMYAPAFTRQINSEADGPKGKASGESINRTELRTDETMKEGAIVAPMPIRRTAVKHVIMQQETVKRVVQQNCGSTLVTGKGLLTTKQGKTVAM